MLMDSGTVLKYNVPMDLGEMPPVTPQKAPVTPRKLSFCEVSHLVMNGVWSFISFSKSLFTCKNMCVYIYIFLSNVVCSTWKDKVAFSATFKVSKKVTPLKELLYRILGRKRHRTGLRIA